MKHFFYFLLSFSFGFLGACQPSDNSNLSDNSSTPAESIEAPASSTATKSPAEAPFDFDQVQKDYLKGNHAQLVNYVNKGITDIIRGSKKVNGADKKTINSSIEDCKKLAVKIRRNHFKEAPILENAVARLEINQARNYLLVAKHETKEEPGEARVKVAKAIQKLEFNVDKLPSSYQSVLMQKISEWKALLKKPEAAFQTNLTETVSETTSWLLDNKTDLGISIPAKK